MEIEEFETAAIKVASLVMNDSTSRRDTLLRHAKQPCNGTLSASFVLAPVPFELSPRPFSGSHGTRRNTVSPASELGKVGRYTNDMQQNEAWVVWSACRPALNKGTNTEGTSNLSDYGISLHKSSRPLTTHRLSWPENGLPRKPFVQL